MRSLFSIALVCCMAGWAAAENFDNRFAEGYKLLDEGDAQGALDSFQELKVESPDSGLVDYSIAAATYALGMAYHESDDEEKATEYWVTAKNSFDRLVNDPDPFLRDNAPLNAANCMAQLARQLDPKKQFKERVTALRSAIAAYEKVLYQQPGNETAQENLDHLRYLLKKMLQNPPPEQQEQDKGEDGQSGDQGEDQEKGNDSQQGDEQDEQQDQQDDGAEDQQQNDSQDDESQSDSPPQPGSSPQDQASDQKMDIDENIEAILNSLEEQNKQEQKNLRRATRPPQVGPGGKWW
jgi:Ca-activated chloride channel homolog